MSPRGRLLLVGIPLLLAGALVAAWPRLRPPTAAEEIREIEGAWRALRDAVLQGDDEAFFLLHSRRARDRAIEGFPAIRAKYLAAIDPEEREAFHRLYHVTAEEFLRGEPRDLVVRMLPWLSGLRDRAEILRVSRVKDVRIEPLTLPDGSVDRRGVVVLDITAALDPSEAGKVPPNFDPTVVFVREEDGWKRREF